jgi:hypothetical protein
MHVIAQCLLSAAVLPLAHAPHPWAWHRSPVAGYLHAIILGAQGAPDGSDCLAFQNLDMIFVFASAPQQVLVCQHSLVISLQTAEWHPNMRSPASHDCLKNATSSNESRCECRQAGNRHVRQSNHGLPRGSERL